MSVIRVTLVSRLGPQLPGYLVQTRVMELNSPSEAKMHLQRIKKDKPYTNASTNPVTRLSDSTARAKCTVPAVVCEVQALRGTNPSRKTLEPPGNAGSPRRGPLILPALKGVRLHNMNSDDCMHVCSSDASVSCGRRFGACAS